jgi:soluble lytic murein transglycosylase-like protein
MKLSVERRFNLTGMNLRSLAVAFICMSVVYTGHAYDSKKYEPMADSILLALRRALNEDPQEPRPVFDSAEHRIHWMSEMSRRLAKRIPNSDERYRLIRLIRYEAQRAGLDPQLVFAVIEVESSFNKRAVSPVGALGLMQIMPFWTDVLSEGDSERLFEPEINVRYGCLILAHYLEIEKGDVARALARYNGSLGRYVYPDKVFEKLEKYWYYRW